MITDNENIMIQGKTVCLWVFLLLVFAGLGRLFTLHTSKSFDINN
jgi:hypothetical protein